MSKRPITMKQAIDWCNNWNGGRKSAMYIYASTNGTNVDKPLLYIELFNKLSRLRAVEKDFTVREYRKNENQLLRLLEYFAEEPK